MEVVFYVLKTTIITLITVVEVAMFVRAIYSWINPEGEGVIASVLYMITEPVIVPFRLLFEKMRWFEGSPLDVPFFATYLVLILVQSILTAIG